MKYVSEHLEVFRTSQPGIWPTTSVRSWLGIRDIPVSETARELQLGRDDLTPDRSDAELFWLILTWGRIQRSNADKVLVNQSAWLDAFSAARHATSRADAYNALAEVSRRLPGMGPAYFTKLLFFAAPTLHAYIMDQWTARSINLLSGAELVRLTSAKYVCKSNTAEIYVQFCEMIDDLARHRSNEDGVRYSGADIETRLFSTGGRNRIAPWRHHVRIHT